MKRAKTHWLGLFVGTACAASLAAAQPGAVGAYLEFDGADDVLVSYADFNTEELTLETWVRVDSMSPRYPSGLITWATWDTGSYELCVGPPDDCRLHFFINFNNGVQGPLRGNTQLEPGVWYHVAATYDGEMARLYVNGVLDGEEFFEGPIKPIGEGARLTIGDDWTGASEFVGGAFDEVMVWGEARTEEEIGGDMGGDRSPGESSLMAYYRFEEVRSNVVIDHSGSGRHAHLGTTFDLGADDPSPQFWGEGAGRRRVLRVSSVMEGDVEAIVGPLEAQLLCINGCSTQSRFSPIINRHQDLHERASFHCDSPLDVPYVDTETFLTGADEVTRHNCESAFYRFSFSMPPLFEDATFYGVANADDMGVVFVNRTAISPLITEGDVDNFGTDRVDGGGHPLLGWPTADPVYSFDRELVRPGLNELIVAVASDVSEFEPAGLEFIFNVGYDCLADWNGDGDHNTIDFLDFLNDWVEGNAGTDVNMDGEVNTLDLLAWMNAWGYGCPE